MDADVHRTGRYARVVRGSEGEQAVADWAALRECTDLAGSLDGAEAMG
jgi:hypothetical protein